MALELPSFDELARVEGMPQGCAWGVFDHDGEKDIFGTLNILTPEVVKAAAREVHEGISISLKSDFLPSCLNYREILTILQLAYRKYKDSWILPKES